MERSTVMSGKRRDNKNRILRNGESQRKDGRYAFKYVDANGRCNLFIAGNLKRLIKRQRENVMIFLCVKRRR